MINIDNEAENTDNGATEAVEEDSQGEGQATLEQPSEGEELSSTTQEETFFDPNQVAEELKPAYKQMQAAFTKKTQEIADIRKNAETWKQQAEKFAKYEQQIPVLEEMLTPKNDQPTAQELMLEAELKKQGYDQQSIDFMKVGAKVLLKQINEQQSQKEFDQTFNRGLQEAEKVDPRLNDTTLVYTLGDGTTITFANVVANYVKSEPNWYQDPVGATKRAIATVDALIGKAKTEGKQELSASARAKAQKFKPLNSSSQQTVLDASPTSMREAAQLAKDELGL